MEKRELIAILKNGIFNSIENSVMDIEFNYFNSVNKEVVRVLHNLASRIENYFMKITSEFKYYNEQLFIVVSYYSYSNHFNFNGDINYDKVDRDIREIFIPFFFSFNRLKPINNIKCDTIRIEKIYDIFYTGTRIDFIYQISFNLIDNFNKIEKISQEIKSDDYHYTRTIKDFKYFLSLYINEKKVIKPKETTSLDIKIEKEYIKINTLILKNSNKIEAEITGYKNEEKTIYKLWIDKNEKSITEIVSDNFIKDISHFLELRNMLNIEENRKLVELIKMKIEDIKLLELLLSQ